MVSAVFSCVVPLRWSVDTFGVVRGDQGSGASAGSMVGDVGGKDFERAAGQSDGSVGMSARAPAVDDVE
jgi:hypothetical protein